MLLFREAHLEYNAGLVISIGNHHKSSPMENEPSSAALAMDLQAHRLALVSRAKPPFFLHGYGRYVCREAQVTLDGFEESDERIRAHQGPNHQNKQAHPNSPPKENRNGAGSYPLEV